MSKTSFGTKGKGCLESASDMLLHLSIVI
jgi:hypothetical protein